MKIRWFLTGSGEMILLPTEPRPPAEPREPSVLGNLLTDARKVEEGIYYLSK